MTSFADEQEPKSELIFEHENNNQIGNSKIGELIDSNLQNPEKLHYENLQYLHQLRDVVNQVIYKIKEQP